MTALVFGSRLPVGSSARITLGPFMSADERHDFAGVDLPRRPAEHAHDLGAGAVLALDVDAGEQRRRTTRSGGHPRETAPPRVARGRWWPGRTGAAWRSR